jgi:diacylglycerol kinase
MMSQVVMSFYYAFDGLFYVLVTQRNMRFHFCMALWVMCFAVILELPDIQKSFLFIIITFVFAMEILNTCIENLTNLMSPDYSKFAKVAKDTAAAAVLVVSIGSLVAAGYLLMGPFFEKVLHPSFWRDGHFQIIAVAVIVFSVLGFWVILALKIPSIIFILPCSAASAFSITYLAVRGGDWLAFTAMMFFSFLLYNSLTRLKTPIYYSLAGHIAGIALFLGHYFMQQ